MTEIITTKTRNLIGPVHIVESEFSVVETKEGITVEKRTGSDDYAKFDEHGRLVEEISAERLLVYQVYRDIYIYDDNGRLSKCEEYDDDGVLIGQQVLEHQPDGGRVATYYSSDGNGDVILSSVLRFDDKDEMVEVSNFDVYGNLLPERSECPVTKTITTQIDEFTTEERRFEHDGSPGLSVVTRYDVKGNQKEFSCFEPDGTLCIKEEYKYEFDAEGNWTIMKSFRWVTGWGEFQLHLYTITRRKIAYY